jgi:predicted metal-dependent phosphoesterase TrpH
VTAVPPGPAGAPRFVDLHSHSTASDGAQPPEAVVAAARAAGITALALTDHDTMDGVAAARAEGERLGVHVVTGVELSAHVGEKEVHLLALHLATTAPLEDRLRELRAARVGRAERMVERLNALGVRVTMADVLAEADGGAVGRPHVARALVNGGWARDSRDAFDRFLGNGRPANVAKQRLDIADAIRMAHDAGGIAVWAHPGPDGTRDAVERLVRQGLDGLEVRHPGHTEGDTSRLGALVDHYRLVPSGGSDWHGAAEGPRVLGCMRVPYEWLERQEARAALHRARAQVA